MASETELQHSIKRRKRERMQSERELLVGSRVEVRSLEDGFLGSWHPGTVIAYFPKRWEVSYDYCLAEDGSGRLEESVPVSMAADGLDAGSYRGRIRPFPPDVSQDPGELLYGLCVDVHHADAWWEGVIFDSNTSAQDRRVFFPDLGDQLVANIRNIRISQDWKGGDGSWLRRGFWSFLKVIQKYEEQFSLPISVKQIWYDLRQEEGFWKIEWTCSNQVLWEKMIFSTLLENVKVAMSCILPRFEPQGKSAREHSAEPAYCPDLDMITSTIALNRPSMAPAGRWQTVDLAPEPACCPDPFASYLVNQVRQCSNSARMVLKRHMAYVGWKMEAKFCGNLTRMRYISPDGKYYYSLLQVCRAQCRNTESIPALSHEDATEILVTPTRRSISSSASPSENSKVCKDPVSSEAMLYDDCHHTPAYCPPAVIDYYALKLEQCSSGVAKELRSKVKQELLAIGWTFSYHQREGRREIVYSSPRRVHYFSLRTACGGCIRDSGIQELMSGTEDCMSAGEEVEAKFASGKSSLSVGLDPNQKALPPPKTIKFDCGQKLRCLGNEPTRLMKMQIKFPRASVKPKHEKKRSQPTHAVRSSKKLQNIVSMNFPQNPKTVLSWLMDNDILLPRTKVYCQRDSSCSSLTEGRAHRDGIKCSCCNELFTLAGFVSHSGSNFSSPAARIFLEDGRSLLDCQVQMLKKKSHLMEDPNDRVIHESYTEKCLDNDYLCSICHYGGNLILCDQCPSSFHNTCLGLKDVPDGDWFCPSCRCGICSNGKLGEEIGNSADVSIVNCYQCKRKYHIACLRKKGPAELADHPGRNWYCSKKCEQIHEGLLELEGKQIKLGMDNLTLTFLKPIDSKRHDDVELHMKFAAENYVKLNIALDVMHECFEHVVEPHSCRDLIEDVIFNRGSELNRLNFRGFYTVLLEKNDELITVATIRIHGEKVAEVPLVGTRFQFHRLGMCHALMNALEEKLKELGVEQIALPAIPSALNTWTGSFGFTKMDELERLQFVNHTFLNFPDTIMCQKQLLNAPSMESTKSNGKLEGLSTVAEEFQGKTMEGSAIFSAAVKDADGSGGSVYEVGKVYEPSQPDGKESFAEYSPEGSSTNADADEKCSREGSDRVFKCYQRRRLWKDSS